MDKSKENVYTLIKVKNRVDLFNLLFAQCLDIRSASVEYYILVLFHISQQVFKMN